MHLSKGIDELLNKLLSRVVFLTFILVLICQSIIYYQPYNLQISLVDKLEGESIKFEEIYPVGDVALEANNVTLKVMNPYITSLPEAKIFLNEKQVGDFTNLQLTVLAEIGDRITIDVSKYSLDLSIKAIPSEGIKINESLFNVKKGEIITIIIENDL